MKLSVKIFLSMSISSLISCILVLGIILNKNYETNIQKENERTVESFSSIANNIEESLEKYQNLKSQDIINTYNSYYKKDDFQFVYVNNNNIDYSSEENLINNISDEILDVKNNVFLSKFIQDEDNFYLYVATAFKNDVSKKIIGIKDITYLYETQSEIKFYGIVIISIATLFITIISFAISKNITKQLEYIANGAKRISKGDYNVNFKETSDEFGKLAIAFNKMVQDINIRTNELISLVESKQTFIDNLSHEMNTPLTTIQGYAEYIERANISPEKRIKYLEYIQQESKRIKDIYKKLLLLSYKKKTDLEIINQDFNLILEEIKQQISRKLNEKNITLVINNKLNSLECDKTLVQIAINNLIINASNISKPNSQIIVNCYENTTNKIIEVIDFGIGISKENINKILEPFYRVDKARSREYGGAGLGLSICKNIMEMHNGKIKIESEIGKGSKFILIF